VGNAKQAAHYYQTAFGYKLIAYRGPETGVRDKASYVLEQGKIRLVLTSALGPEHEVAQHVLRHGDGVKVLALWVDDARDAFEKAVARGAQAAAAPQVLEDEHGQVVLASIHTYGETLHTFVERKHYEGAFMPGFQPRASLMPVEPIGLKYVDHCVGNVELGDDEQMGEILPGRDGLQAAGHFRRQGHLDRVHRPDEQGGVQRQRLHQIPDQRAGEGLEEIADRGVPRVTTAAPACSTSPWPPTISSTPWTSCASAASSFLYVPDTYYDTVEERVGRSRKT
jgi:4-hydroxyphenylpyruvate dioxygenase